ncbi:PP2C family protein-serine/threonine phosphatase [Yinghuangia seranimata]|uniref:PP2C family protein-serine/threonine phosphatase n=1 Tax=Yinghuangia seranimata TaxID=408067 RepID=UPI00248C917F|nr:PP2C family protein-serine/threonine phosphatase [Yinghuangia seranimata]MDI2129926.1 PP2C family protein-serine/threonine phosphatase [Yinghuangia seranimata]
MHSRDPAPAALAPVIGALVAHWSPFLLIAVAAAADIAAPEARRFDQLLAAAPALAAATWGVPGTLLIGLLSAVMEFALSYERNDAFANQSGIGTGVILAVTLAAAYASRVRQRQERDLSDVRAVAETAQGMVLRPLPPRLGDVELAVRYEAAAAQARIGGDFYEALRTPYGVRVILGDVQGKGLASVEVASVLLGAFREAAYDTPGLPELRAGLELSMQRYSEQQAESDAAERFATAVLVEIPEGAPVARLLNCGHPPPLRLGADGGVRGVEPSVPLLPVNLGLTVDDRPQVDEIAFGPGDRLLLYTDGVSETRDRDGAFYPLAERVRAWAREPSDGLLDALRADMSAFGAGERDDDVAVLAVRRAGGPGGSTWPDGADGTA